MTPPNGTLWSDILSLKTTILLIGFRLTKNNKQCTLQVFTGDLQKIQEQIVKRTEEDYNEVV